MTSKVLSTEQVKVWAETLGIHNLPEDAAEFIATSAAQKTLAIIDRANRNANMSRRMKILKTDIDSAMQYLNLEPTADIGVSDYIPIRGVSGVGGKTLYVHDDKDRDLHNVAKKNVTNIPADINLRQHWLALEGKQPAVPENPSPLSKEEQKAKAADSKKSTKITTDRAVRKSQMVCIKELATSDLSAEQQQYYKDITEAVIGSIEEKRREALTSLEHDPGLHALIPRLAVFVAEGVKVNVVQQNLALLIYIMRMVKGMLDNQSLYLQPYLHIITPAVTSCIVSRMLCSRPEVDNHWALRGFAARILAAICKAYDATTNRMSQRLIQMFKYSLDESTSSLATRYGAFSALFELGNEAISTMVIPRIKQEAEALQITQRNSSDPADKKATEKIRELLVTRVADYCRSNRPGLEKVEDFRLEFGSYLGPLIYDNYVKEKNKESSKARVQSTGGTPRMVSPHNNLTNSVGSPASRLPVASPIGNVMSPVHSLQSPVHVMRPTQSVASNRPIPPVVMVPNVGGSQTHPHFSGNATTFGHFGFTSSSPDRSGSQKDF